jgi:hypothetical protein
MAINANDNPEIMINSILCFLSMIKQKLRTFKSSSRPPYPFPILLVLPFSYYVR